MGPKECCTDNSTQKPMQENFKSEKSGWRECDLKNLI